MTKFKLYCFVFLVMIVFSAQRNTYAQIEPLDFRSESVEIELTPPKSEENKKLPGVDENDLVHFGDLIDVDILGSDEYDWRGKITPEGFLDGIEFTADSVYGLCQTGEQIAAEIVKSYGKFLKDPKIVVTILDRSRRPLSTLYGAVRLPQKFELRRKVFLTELIVLAGGFTEKASGEIRIFRQPDASCVTKLQRDREISDSKKNTSEGFVKIKQGNGSKIINIKISDLLNGNEDANPRILYGDFVTVFSAEPIYVIGGVVNPTKISERTELTVSRAIDSAGGLTENADAKRVTVFRREAGKIRVIKIDLTLEEGENSGSFILKAYDVVDVAESGSDEKKYPPIVRSDGFERNSIANLPTRVID